MYHVIHLNNEKRKNCTKKYAQPKNSKSLIYKSKIEQLELNLIRKLLKLCACIWHVIYLFIVRVYLKFYNNKTYVI